MVARPLSRRLVLTGALAILGIVAVGVGIIRQLPAEPRGAAPAAPSGNSQQALAIERTPGPAAATAPVTLVWYAPDGRSGLLGDIDGFLPAGPGVDVIWQRGSLLLMKQKGRADLVWSANGINQNFTPTVSGGTTVCFDGRYVWAGLCRHGATPLLVVVDPENGKSWSIGVDQSWRVLGRMLEETEFIQLWRRGYFMRFQWSVPNDEFIDAVAGVARGHRLRPLIETLSSDAARQLAATDALIARLELEELGYDEQRALVQAIGRQWQSRSAQQYVEAERRPALHMDDVYRDLLKRMESEQWRSSGNLVERLSKVSSRSPDAVAAQIRQLRFGNDLATLEQKFGAEFADTPQFWKALSQIALSPEDRKTVYRRYIALSPDAWAYRALANQLKGEGKMDEWKATLDDCLKQPAFGLEHAQLQVEIANYFMQSGDYERARPYAADAAETWAEWAILCAIHCYQGLGDYEHEGIWRARIVERYPKLPYWIDYYVWTRVTGLGDSAEVLKTLRPMVAALPESTRGSRLGMFYQLIKQPRRALAAYQEADRGAQDARGVCFDDLWTAALAQELGETQQRDAALARVAKAQDPAVSQYRKLAEWLAALVALERGAPPDLAAVRAIVAAAGPNDRPTLNAFIGRFLDLCGQQEPASDFYREAAESPDGRFSATCNFVRALLRDRAGGAHDGLRAAESK